MDVWIAMFISVVGLYVSWRAYYLAHETVLVDIYFQMMQTYSSSQMNDDLKLLGEWEKKDEKEYLEFGKSYSNRFVDKGDYKEIDQARRRVEHYFKNAHRLFKKFPKSEKYRNGIFELYGIRLYFLVIERMEKAMGQEDANLYDPKEFKEIFDIAKKIDPKLVRPCD